MSESCCIAEYWTRSRRESSFCFYRNNTVKSEQNSSFLKQNAHPINYPFLKTSTHQNHLKDFEKLCPCYIHLTDLTWQVLYSNNKKLCYGRGTTQHACQYGLESRTYHVAGIICVILHLAALIQYRSVTDRHTHRHTTTAYTALSIVR